MDFFSEGFLTGEEADASEHSVDGEETIVGVAGEDPSAMLGAAIDLACRRPGEFVIKKWVLTPFL